MQKIFLFLLLAAHFSVMAQPVKYTTGNLHSHNDYEQKEPFTLAYSAELGSIEADIFLKDGTLLVAHDTTELSLKRSLQTLYLQPLEKALEKNNGHPYKESNKKLQLLIDVKTSAIPTLARLLEELKSYPLITKSKRISIVISGNRPTDSLYKTYPSYIYFDGILSKDYQKDALQKIVMMSDNFRNYSAWRGNDSLSAADAQRLQNAIQKAHKLKLTVRFWNAPDNPYAWTQFMQLKVDYINTDHIKEAADFIRRH